MTEIMPRPWSDLMYIVFTKFGLYALRPIFSRVTIVSIVDCLT